MTFFLAAALLGCHNGGADNDSDGNPNTNPDDTGDSGSKSGTATLTYTVSVLGNEEPCTINLTCDANATYTDASGQNVEVSANTLFSVPSGDIVAVDAPAQCSLTAGLEDYVDMFGFPVHLGNDGEYWASPGLDLPLQPDDEISGDFSTFNLFRPGDSECWYNKYQLDEDASDLKGKQWMDHEEIDKQHVGVLQDGTVEVEDDPNMSVIGRDEDHMLVVGDELTLVVASGGNPYYIAESDIGVDYFSLTVVNTEAGYVADVRCDMDD